MLPNGHKTKEMETAVSVAWLLASLHLPDYPHLSIMKLIISFWKYKPLSHRLSSPNCSACHCANGSLATRLFLLSSLFLFLPATFAATSSLDGLHLVVHKNFFFDLSSVSGCLVFVPEEKYIILLYSDLARFLY